jgi:ER lumen protein retaining receptor
MDDDDDADDNGRGVENNNAAPKPGRWGARGISVSADEGVLASSEDARPLADPDAFEDDLTDDDAPPPAAKRLDDPVDSPWRE